MKLLQKTTAVILLSLSALLAFAQEDMNDEDGWPFGHKKGEVHAIDHQNNIIVLNDFSYAMALNFVVTDSKGRKLNRYAIKPGDKVEYFAELFPHKRSGYVKWLQIKK